MKMRVLFVHGMGRSPLSGWPLLFQLRKAGFITSTFWYSTTVEDFARIRGRLLARLTTLSREGPYVVIGHSLGGILLREAIAAMPRGAPRPEHLFLLASPVQPPALARKFADNPLYRFITGDCGQLLGSHARMASLAPTLVPTTAIAGTRGFPWGTDPFSGELNDGVVSLSEVTAEWLKEIRQIDTVHTLLPASHRVGEIIIDKIRPYME